MNLIALNPGPEIPYQTPDPEAVAIQQIVRRAMPCFVAQAARAGYLCGVRPVEAKHGIERRSRHWRGWTELSNAYSGTRFSRLLPAPKIRRNFNRQAPVRSSVPGAACITRASYSPSPSVPIVIHVNQLTADVIRPFRCQEQRQLKLLLRGNAAGNAHLLGILDFLAARLSSPACRISSVIWVYTLPGEIQFTCTL